MLDWKQSLMYAVKAIQHAKIPNNGWTFGGGTALMFFYNHRLSNDIDIFLNDPQYLNFFLPTLNDYTDSISCDYIHCFPFIKLKIDELGENEIDFIASPGLTPYRPILINIDENEIPFDHPFEIIAKKVFYRGANFTFRDIFDLATVYYYNKNHYCPANRK